MSTELETERQHRQLDHYYSVQIEAELRQTIAEMQAEIDRLRGLLDDALAYWRQKETE